jgi:hypothetical protein
VILAPWKLAGLGPSMVLAPIHRCPPNLSILAISVAPMPSAFMARTLAASIEAGRPLELTLRRKRIPSVVRYAITLHLDRCHFHAKE